MLYPSVLDIECDCAQVRVLGVKHPSTASTAANLAELLARMELWDQAAKFATEAHTTRLAVLGTEHESTCASGNLAELCRAMQAMVKGQPCDPLPTPNNALSHTEAQLQLSRILKDHPLELGLALSRAGCIRTELPCFQGNLRKDYQKAQKIPFDWGLSCMFCCGSCCHFCCGSCCDFCCGSCCDFCSGCCCGRSSCGAALPSHPKPDLEGLELVSCDCAPAG